MRLTITMEKLEFNQFDKKTNEQTHKTEHRSNAIAHPLRSQMVKSNFEVASAHISHVEVVPPR